MTSPPSSADAIVVGAGPNGLAAAIELARAGLSVTLVEGDEEIGGGVRSAALTLPGFVHDVCSAVYPLGVASPFFTTLPLAEHGLEWIHPPAPQAHPQDDGSAVQRVRSF
jgi:phytoene dehydrogenase-like protein